jgi:hypothetical protein
MMKSSLKILLLALALGSAPQALSGTLGDLLRQIEDVDQSRRGDDGILMIAQSNGPSLAEAVQMVKRQYNGRIVSAETRISGNREVHHIKVLTEDGKVKTVKIPGRTRQR